MLTIEICVLSIEIKREKSILNGGQNEEDYCAEADREGKGLQTTWFLLLIVKLISSHSFHEHCSEEAV